jgi:hypothetical protein
VWVLFWAALSIINATREIIHYGFKGQDVPIISYWGYVGMFIGLMLLPTLMTYYEDKNK